MFAITVQIESIFSSVSIRRADTGCHKLNHNLESNHPIISFLKNLAWLRLVRCTCTVSGAGCGLAWSDPHVAARAVISSPRTTRYPDIILWASAGCVLPPHYCEGSATAQPVARFYPTVLETEIRAKSPDTMMNHSSRPGAHSAVVTSDTPASSGCHSWHAQSHIIVMMILCCMVAFIFLQPSSPSLIFLV